MRSLVLLVACGCGGGKRPAQPVPIANESKSCAEAAAGLEAGTRGLRDPDTSVVTAARALCLDDAWSPAAVACFAAMTQDELGRCAGELPPAARDKLFAQLGGAGDDRTAIAIAQARLHGLEVPIAECNTFVKTVARALGCEAMPLSQRVQLGNETADFWSLPPSAFARSQAASPGEGGDARRRMAEVCERSVVFLRQQVTDAGCMP